MVPDIVELSRKRHALQHTCGRKFMTKIHPSKAPRQGRCCYQTRGKRLCTSCPPKRKEITHPVVFDGRSRNHSKARGTPERAPSNHTRVLAQPTKLLCCGLESPAGIRAKTFNPHTSADQPHQNKKVERLSPALPYIIYTHMNGHGNGNQPGCTCR